MLQDFRFAVKNLLKNQGFAAVAIISLALGIGANTAIFSVVRAVLLRPLPYPDQDRLVLMDEVLHGTHATISWLNFKDWQTQNVSFEDLAAIHPAAYNDSSGEQPELVSGLAVSPNLFKVLGARATLGRLFDATDDSGEGERTVVLTDAFWRRRFGSNPAAIGKVLHFDGNSFTIVGVLPPQFSVLGREAEVFTPIGVMANDRQWMKDRGDHVGIRVIGRLKTGISMERARSDMATVAARLEKQYPATNSNIGAIVEPFYEKLVADARPTLRMLLAAVGFVLLITCVNMANLLFARGSARSRELAVRAALGGSRLRIVRQLLVESVVIAILGGALGFAVAGWSLAALLGLAPQDVPRLAQASLDWTVLSFCLGISVLAGVLFGLAPAWRLTRTDLLNDIKVGGRGHSPYLSSRLRSTLLIGEVALAVLTVTGAGLMLRSIVLLQRVDPGFQPEGVVTFGTLLPSARYSTTASRVEFFRQVLEKIRSTAGVESAAAVDCLPLDGGCWGSSYSIEGRPVASNGDLPLADFNGVSAGYFETMKATLVAGRFFNERDTEKSTPVAIINETMARHMFPHENPIGKHIRQGLPQYQNEWREVVGVVRDIQRYDLDHRPVDEISIALTQLDPTGLNFVVRLSGTGKSTAAIAAAVHQIDRYQPLADLRPMTSMLAATLAQRRFSSLLLGIFAALALGLAAIGTYGVMAYSVTLQRQELGIRLALGADRMNLFGFVLRRGLWQASVGIGIGLIPVVASTWLIGGLLYGVGPRDPLTLIGASAVLMAVSMLACYLPARRAARLDPMIVLRTD